jgi:hypothetical protein
VRAFAAEAEQYQPLRDYVLEAWRRRYPQCGPWSAE